MSKDTKPGQENLHQPFPGFSPDSEFGSELVFDDALVREIPERRLRRLARADIASATAEAVEIYADGARSLAETGRCRVIVCARPEELLDREARPPAAEAGGAVHDEEPDEHDSGADFHDLLKATALTLAAPLQLMRRACRPDHGQQPFLRLGARNAGKPSVHSPARSVGRTPLRIRHAV